MRVLTGRALMLLGLMAWVAAVPVTTVLVRRWWVADADVALPDGSEAAAIVWVLAWLLVPWGLRAAGRWLIGDEERVVLFLRGFRFAQATDAVTFAIASTLGSAWRLVTLDDGSVAPIGVPATVSGPLRLVHWIRTAGECGFTGLRRALVAYGWVAFAEHARATVIDVSEPTDHLLWEVDALLRREHMPCIFIGAHDRVGDLAADLSPDQGPQQQRLAVRLEAQAVLAYTTDRRGLRRFARALRNVLRSQSFQV